MDDVKPKRRVTGQISLPSSTSGSAISSHSPSITTSSSAPRIRARVNPSSLSSPSTSASTPPPTRPSVRSTPSSSSIRSHVTSSSASTSISRPRSPAPPANHTRASTSSSPHTHMTPVARARVENASHSQVGGGGGSNHGTPTTKTPRIRSSVSTVKHAPSPHHTPPDLRRGESEPVRSSASINGNNGTVRARVRALSRTDPPSGFPTSSTTSTHPVLSTQYTSHHANSPRHPPTPQSPPAADHENIQHHPFLSPRSMMTSVRPQSPPSASSSSLASRGLALSNDVGFPQHFTTITQRDVPQSAQFDNDEPSSNHSSPVRPLRPLDTTPHNQLASIIAQQSIASCPPTPAPASCNFPAANGDSSHHDRRKQRPQLPWNPLHPPPPLPQPPTSPELRTVALPALTPTFSRTSASASISASGIFSNSGSDAASRRLSGTESEMSVHSHVLVEPTLIQTLGGSVHVERTGRDRLSGSTAVDEDDEEGFKKEENDLNATMQGDARLAKIDRKIADLEISNASLLAINRSLEATKSKQRSEIIKLRRQLRESLQGIHPHPVAPLTSPRTDLESPNLTLGTPGISSVFSAEFMDDVMEDDPELEARWDRLADLVTAMCKRGADAIEKSVEELKVGGGRVLGWLEVEQMQEAQVSGVGGSVEGEMGSADISRGVSLTSSPRPSLGEEEKEGEQVEGMLLDVL